MEHIEDLNKKYGIDAAEELEKILNEEILKSMGKNLKVYVRKNKLKTILNEI